MGADATEHVIGRKAAAARRALEARSMSPARALRRALSWAADDLWGMALVCQSVQSEVLDQEAAPDALNPGEVLIVLDGPEGAVGLFAIEPALLAGLVERQTLGVVLRTPATDRTFTPTDAAMAAPLIDCMMGRFATNLDAHPLADQLSGFRFGAMIEDARTAGLVLDAAEYRTYRVTIDLEHGAKMGDLQVLLPIRDVTPLHTGEEDVSGPHEQTFLLVPAQINAILARLSMPLARASALKPGDLLPLPADALGRTRIMVGQNEMLTRGALGQMNGFRAVRLDLPARPGHLPDEVLTNALVPMPEAPVEQDPGHSGGHPVVQEDASEFVAADIDLPPLDLDDLGGADLPDMAEWETQVQPD